LHKHTKIMWIKLITIALIGCSFMNGTFAQKQRKMNKTEKTTNPLICDPIEGTCELPENNTSATPLPTMEQAIKSIKIIYYTDPICSSCWGIEPQLRKLKLEYGHAITIDYRMGGLLPDWSYNSGGISNPSDVAHHWDEVSAYYKMPIDGDVWLEDPLDSSFPPSIYFKAAQLQDDEKAIIFLRLMREELFLKKKNITKWDIIKQVAELALLDTVQLQHDFQTTAKTAFQEDLVLARQLGVRGFPTLLFYNGSNKSEVVYGFRPYEQFEQTIQKLMPTIQKVDYPKNPSFLFGKFPTLTTREYAELMEKNWSDAEKELLNFKEKGILQQLTTKNGDLWIKVF
jgi:putative protein-disulfide isomerase